MTQALCGRSHRGTARAVAEAMPFAALCANPQFHRALVEFPTLAPLIAFKIIASVTRFHP
jgi:hypothetical protein